MAGTGERVEDVRGTDVIFHIVAEAAALDRSTVCDQDLCRVTDRSINSGGRHRGSDSSWLL